MIQDADVLAGSVAQLYEEKAVGDIAEVYNKHLRKQTLGLLEWLRKFNSLLPPPMEDPCYVTTKCIRKLSSRQIVSSSKPANTPMRINVCRSASLITCHS